MRDLVIGELRGGVVVEWLEQHPDVAAELRERNLRVVIVEPERRTRSQAAGALFVNTQAAIDAAIDAAIVPEGTQPVFVAWTSLKEIESTGAFTWGYRGQPLVKMRGRFVGYIVYGYGGADFFDETGTKYHDPASELILALL